MTAGPGRRAAIVQSNYIPWKGYFDLINAVDEFVLLDNVQYTRRDWRNRNRIKTPAGTRWLTIPVQVSGRYEQRIDEVFVSDSGWRERHWKTLVHNYARADCFDEVRPVLEPLYLDRSSTRLSDINRSFIDGVCAYLGIATRISWSTDYEAPGERSARLVALCKAVGASEYVTGGKARGYLDTESFAANGIAVSYFEYEGYPEYPQVHPPFVHAVSIVDLLLNTGPDARRFMKTLSVGSLDAA